MVLAGTVASATAGGPADVRLFVSSAAGDRAVPFLSFGESISGPRGQLDYALFATELLAFVTKEVMSDSREEYTRSPLGSRWSADSSIRRQSEFGSHCLMIVGRIGSAVPQMMPSAALEGTPTVASYAVGAATTGLALRQIWRAFERDIRDDRGGVSLDPKVSSRRLGVNLTLHW